MPIFIGKLGLSITLWFYSNTGSNKVPILIIQSKCIWAFTKYSEKFCTKMVHSTWLRNFFKDIHCNRRRQLNNKSYFITYNTALTLRYIMNVALSWGVSNLGEKMRLSSLSGSHPALRDFTEYNNSQFCINLVLCQMVRQGFKNSLP